MYTETFVKGNYGKGKRRFYGNISRDLDLHPDLPGTKPEKGGLGEHLWKKHKFKYTAGRALRHIVLALWCATTAFPILWTLMVSFKDNSQIFTAPFAWPNPVISSNFSDIFAKLNIPRGFLNSIIYSFFYRTYRLHPLGHGRFFICPSAFVGREASFTPILS